ncbi:glycoside hydrolase family 2 TIM barrel-domain containing protein [Aeoliella mucimassa]|uniref:Beta-galactosidase n=1 Tax=Aeoliella mucimassa TaxID=2527972 RepID=A0A518AJV5_9BACT|nr:glycoside hydrolase family 2 TIM barrel-domain containing protein [Aeoliella mucimassa]QDU54995.1 Beta-galactosidase [Aeoliella mucimassa]
MSQALSRLAKLPQSLRSLSMLTLAAVALSLPASLSSADNARQQLTFDFDWRFHLGDVPQGPDPSLDHQQWRQLSVPHDWSIEHSFSPDHASGTGYLPGGIGWYRKSFEVPADWQGREVTLHFDGVYRNSEVWLNGQRLGERPYGYAPFYFRLTPYLKTGETNVLAVRVARQQVADSRWYTGTGIYRHVWLTVTNPVHVDTWGTFVTTPRVTDERADIHVTNEVVNHSEQPAEILVETSVLAPDGSRLGEQSTKSELAAGAKYTFAHWHMVEDPQRWTLDEPTLYTMETRIVENGETVDVVRTPFGIRTYYFDADDGFFLNGQAMKIKGVCLHHDAGVVGAAVPDKVLERRLRIVKQLGANAVRCSHNPMAKELYSLCDEIGLLVMDEAFDEWELGKRKWVKGRNVGRAERFGYNEHFEEWAEQDVEAMVRRGRNHPSIILWSIGNEIDYPGDPYVHPEFFDPAAPPADAGSPKTTRLAVVAPSLIAAVKRHDPTRPVTMALSNVPASNDIGLANMLDVAGYNYQEQFYSRDHRDFPGRVIYGSENGQGPPSWQAVADNDYISSIYLWSGFDFLGEAGEWPNHGSKSGVFDTRGFLKPRAWMHRLNWSDEAIVHLTVNQERRNAPRRLFSTSRTPRLWKTEEGTMIMVLIASNCDRVELTLNGKPLEVSTEKFGPYFRARVPFTAGTLAVSGFKDDQLVATDSLVTPGPAAKLELVADREALAADGQDVAHVEIRVVDEAGTLATDATTEVTVEVTGHGKLLGVDNGDQDDTTNLLSPTKKTSDGRLLAIVKSTRTAGELTITVESAGLAPVELMLPTSSE